VRQEIFRLLGFEVALALALSPAARGVTLDTKGTGSGPPPPPPRVACTLTENDIVVTSFAGMLGYQMKGSCTVTFPGTGIPPVPAAPYEGGGSWNEQTGQVNEYLRGRDARNRLWEISGGGTCRLDPWMVGRAGAGCSASVSNATPNAPTTFVKSLGVPVSAGLLDQQARGWLTGKTLRAIKAEHQAPKILKPAEGSLSPGDVSLKIDPGPESPTKTFSLEWQARVNGQWVAQNVGDVAGIVEVKIPASKFGASGEWRLRARAHQNSKASWSDWRGFKVPLLAPPPQPCQNASAFGATYDVGGTPGTLKAGATASNVPIKVTNGSNQTWGAGSNIHLAYHWVQGGATVVFDGERTWLPAAVSPCGTILLQAKLKAPPAPGSYVVEWDMVQEGVAWFSTKGVATGNKAVTVTP
jgi:hypothetical protein